MGLLVCAGEDYVWDWDKIGKDANYGWSCFEADELRKAIKRTTRVQNTNQKVIDGLSPERYLNAFEKLLIAWK